MSNLWEALSRVTDFRRAQGRMHELRLLLIIVIMAIMSGSKGIRAMGDFVQRNQEELIKTLKPKKDRLPSRQTIGRSLQNVDFDQLTEVFYQWAINYVSIADKDWISIDGKAIGSTVSHVRDPLQKFVSLVSVFASRQRQVIKAGKILNQKESEIPKVRELINALDLTNVIFTLDALHCQKETVKTIVKSGNDYCIGVKGNQKKLYRQIKKKSLQMPAQRLLPNNPEES